MTLIVALSLLLIGAHLLGRIAERFGQPALLGQMLAGIALGPSLLGWVRVTPTLSAVADLSVLFVVVTAGLEMRMQHVVDAFRGKGVLALLLGLAIPAAAAAIYAYAMEMTVWPGTVVTLCVSVTALPVALRILDGFGLLHAPWARIAISSALLSDVIVLMALGVALSIAAPAGGATANHALLAMGIAIGKVGVLLLVVGACHRLCLRWSASGAWNKSANGKSSADAVLVVTLLFVFGLGAISELLGLHFVIGGFLAALLVTRDLISDARFENLERTCEVMTVSLFGPLFLAFQGVLFEAQALSDYWFVVGLLAVAIASKLCGGYATARLSRLDHRDALGAGIVMNARGVVGMVVASIAYRAGLVDQALFSALLLVCMVTSVMTPFMLKRWMSAAPKQTVQP